MPKRPPDWTVEEDARLLQLRNEEGLDWRQISQRMDRPWSGCKTRYYDIRDNPEPEDYEDSVVYNDIHALLQPFEGDKVGVDWRERLHVAQQGQSIRQRDDITVQIARRTIITDRPFGVWFTGDLHLGSVGTRMDAWEEHTNEFIEMENVAALFMGDYIANIAIHRNVLPVFQQVMTPEEQGLMFTGLLVELRNKGKILAVILTEEHDQRDARHTGVSFLRQLLRPFENDIPFLDNRGAIILDIGPDEDHLIPYVIYAVHKARYRSFLNELHTANRLARLDIPANVICTAHTHKPAMGVYPWFAPLQRVLAFMDVPVQLGGKIYAVQCGTYETEAQYANQNYGWSSTEIDTQVLVFDPHRHHIEMCNTFDAAKKLIA